jgi:glycosyltransferase involved in cell wall biosynthesis
LEELSIAYVITTMNRAGRCLDKTLASLEALEHPNCRWEIAIGDNGSTDHTRAMVEEFARRMPVPVHYVNQPKPGKCRALNAAILATSASWLALSDDDCYPQPDYLRALEKAVQTHREAAYFGGRVLLYDPTDADITTQYDNSVHIFPPYGLISPGHIHGANMCCRRSAWEQAGGFDNRFGAGTPFGSDDVEFLTRISGQGLGGAFEPSLVVLHHHGRKPGPEMRQRMLYYAEARGAFYAAALGIPSMRAKILRFWLGTTQANIRKGDWDTIKGEIRGAWGLWRTPKEVNLPEKN